MQADCALHLLVFLRLRCIPVAHVSCIIAASITRVVPLVRYVCYILACTLTCLSACRCQPGYFCPSASEQLLCPAGNYCPEQSMDPTPCVPLAPCPPGTASPPFSYTWLVFVIVALLLMLAVYLNVRRVENVQQERAAHAGKHEILNMVCVTHTTCSCQGQDTCHMFLTVHVACLLIRAHTTCPFCSSGSPIQVYKATD
jgi:hypothetical protein